MYSRNFNQNIYFKSNDYDNPATGWFEIAYMNEPNSGTTLRLFDFYLLFCYPQPTEVGIDNRNEFKSLFLELYNNFGIKVKYTMDYNPHCNSIVE